MSDNYIDNLSDKLRVEWTGDTDVIPGAAESEELKSL